MPRPVEQLQPAVRGRRRRRIAAAAALVLLGSPAVAKECPGTGDCLEPHELPGCGDASCCETICTLDPFCCESWDLNCATLADVTCAGLCGAQASGSCFTPNGSASCDDRTCCESVCLADSFCCSTNWDANCALFAGFICEVAGGECGDAGAGDCFDPNGTPACNDESCCDAVCAVDPSCCDLNWDAICVALATEACLDPCVVGIASNDFIEAEGCDGDSNDPCSGGVAEVWTPNRAMHGTFRAGDDRDVLLLDLTDADLDGDGDVRIRLLFSATDGTLTMRERACDGAVVLESSAIACIESATLACVPATLLALEIAANAATPPCDQPGWRVELEVADTCGPVCGNEFDCLTPHTAPGCDDVACCDLVCLADPFCCAWTWDSPCTVLAAAQCGGPPPVNDACLDALEIGLGSTPFRQLLSSSSAPDGTCLDPSRRGGDIWFRHVAACDGTMRIGTCSTADFDTLVEVFTGPCADLTEVACIDDEGFCLFNTGSVFFDAVCGETYLVRVSGVDEATGSGEILVECYGSTCPCPGDLDGDGVVGGADLGMLFSAWGPCPKGCPADLDGDGTVGGSDLGTLFSAWGDC